MPATRRWIRFDIFEHCFDTQANCWKKKLWINKTNKNNKTNHTAETDVCGNSDTIVEWALNGNVNNVVSSALTSRASSDSLDTTLLSSCACWSMSTRCEWSWNPGNTSPPNNVPALTARGDDVARCELRSRCAASLASESPMASKVVFVCSTLCCVCKRALTTQRSTSSDDNVCSSFAYNYHGLLYSFFD